MTEHHLDDPLGTLVHQGLRAATEPVAAISATDLARKLEQRRHGGMPLDAAPSSPRSRRVLAAAAALVVAVLATGVWWVARDGDSTGVVTEPPPADPETTAGPLDAWEPGWHEISLGPVPAMDPVSLAWTGERLVVAGTTAAGPQAWAFDPAEPGWVELPPPPFPVADLTAAGGTLVAAGNAQQAQERLRWAMLPAGSPVWDDLGAVPVAENLSPFEDAHGPRAELLWTGQRVVHAGYGATLDPATGETDTIAVPGNVPALIHLASARPVWTGHHLVLSSWSTEPGLAWDATGRTSKEVPGPLSDEGLTMPMVLRNATATVAGDEVVLLAGGEHGPGSAALDVDAARWRTLPTIPSGASWACPHRATTVVGEAVVQGCEDGRRVAPLRLTDEGWVPLGDVPWQEWCCGGAWLGIDEALFMVSSSVDASNNPDAADWRGAMWIPGGPAAEVVEAVEAVPPADDPLAPPLDLLPGGAVTWTGEEVVVLTGSEYDASGWPSGPVIGAAFAPDDQTWRPLATAPLELADQPPVVAVAATDAGVVAAVGEQLARWDPRTDTWQVLGDPPGPVRDLAAIGGDLAVSASANAVLDAAAGTWTPLADPPLALDYPAVVWTGELLVAVGAEVGATFGADADGTFSATRAVALDGETLDWRLLPDPPGLGSGALAVAWDGQRVVAVNYDQSAAAFDPGSDTWSSLPTVPVRSSEWTPTAVGVPGMVVAGFAWSQVVLDGDLWYPMTLSALPHGNAVALDGDRAGQIALWPSTQPRPVLHLVDLAALRAEAPLRVGAASVALGPDDRLTEATSAYEHWQRESTSEVQRVAVSTPAGTCRIVATTLYPDAGETALRASEGAILDGETADGVPWYRSPDGDMWEAALQASATSGTDVVRLTCDEPDDARRLGTGIRLRP